MPVEDMVDAALVGLDQGELVTIPGLHNEDEWTRFEAARRSMLQQFGTSVPAPRYRNQSAKVSITGEKCALCLAKTSYTCRMNDLRKTGFRFFRYNSCHDCVASTFPRLV